MKPLTRKEFFMAKAAGQTVPDLEPITREEYFLNQIAENGGGGGLPPIEEGDDGKVLTASDGEAAWESAGGGLPEITGADDGKLLGASDGEAAWVDGGSLYPYDFVIKCLGSFNNLNLNQLNIEKGTLQDIEEKIHDEQKPVTGCLIQYRQTEDPSQGYVLFEKYNLIYADVYYISLIFASQRQKDTNGGGILYLYYDEYYVINDYSWNS